MAEEELSGLRAAIQQELDLARRGEGYEEKAVADEIVERFVLPLLAPMRAKHYTPYVDEEHQGGYCFDFFAPTLGRMARAERERDLALAEVDRAEEDNNRLRLEISRLRREVEFEANGADTFSGADEIASRPVCAVHPEGGVK